MTAIIMIDNDNNDCSHLSSFSSFSSSSFSMMVRGAEENGLSYFVPCYGRVSCLTFDYDSSSSSSSSSSSDPVVLAGHFSYGVWEKLSSCQKSKKNCRPSCLVIGRNPIDRVVSYYYQRLFLEGNSPFHQRRLNDLDSTEWEQLLVSHRFARFQEEQEKDEKNPNINPRIVMVDEGMSNAFCRTILNRRTTSGLRGTAEEVSSQLSELPAELSFTDEDFQVGIGNMGSCVVGVLERWEETTSVLETWFPWMNQRDDHNNHNNDLISEKKEKEKEKEKDRGGASLKKDKKTGLNRASDQLPKEKKTDLRPEILEVIERHNQCDLLFYRELVARFDRQLAAMEEMKGYSPFKYE
jgi:hypothetical protein